MKEVTFKRACDVHSGSSVHRRAHVEAVARAQELSLHVVHVNSVVSGIFSLQVLRQGNALRGIFAFWQIVPQRSFIVPLPMPSGCSSLVNALHRDGGVQNVGMEGKAVL